jgi:hypothetical protein
LQLWPEGQAWAQAPQFWLSVWTLTQRAPQSCSPLRQVAWHLAAEHFSPEGQTIPQLPQLLTSMATSAQ